MTITGGIKFFARSSALYKDGTTATSDYASGTANNILTNRQLTYSQSVGADDDTTTVTWTITYNQSVTIDRVFLNRINFKEFTVKYYSDPVWVHFSNVVGMDGSIATGIVETAFADETAYYEVSSITTTGIQITVLKTQVVDAEKIIYNLFTTSELGTLEQYPQISPIAATRNSRVSGSLSGLANVQKGYETLSFSLNFKNHPSQSDFDLLTTLYNRDKSFLVWLCGGRRGSTYFRFNIKGYGLRDINNMQAPAGINPSYPSSIYVNAPNNSMAFVNSI